MEETKIEEQGEVKKRRINNKILLLIPILIILFLVLSYFITRKEILTDQETTNIPEETFILGEKVFAKYELKETTFTPSLPSYTINYTELSNFTNFEKAEGTPFTTSQKEALNKNNFFIKKNDEKFYDDNPDKEVGLSRVDDWTDLYTKIGGAYGVDRRQPEDSVFITSDFLLHVYHRLLEKEFEYIEQTNLYPTLKDMTDTLLESAIVKHKSSNSENKESYERVIAYFSVPKVMLDSAYDEFLAEDIGDMEVDTKENMLNRLESLSSIIPENSYTLAKNEFELIFQGAMQQSPIFGKYLAQDNLVTQSDYSQYTPRSHYNKNSVLRSYFKAMIWYGTNNFVIQSPELTRDALNISLIMAEKKQQKNWDYIYSPTTFFVGKSDDLGVIEYLEVIDKLKIKTVTDKTIAQVQKEVEKYPNPQIMSSAIVGDKVADLTKKELQDKTKGFRFMGQRFTPDAFIFTTLTQGDEKEEIETGESLPSSTTALMVMSSIGNKTADSLVDTWIDKNAPDSKNVLNNRLTELKKHFSTTSQELWTQNIYWNWLFTIKSLSQESLDKTGYPNFTKNDAWDKKNLQSSLGSWTELKHDTLLYAKQAAVERGAGGELDEPLPVPKGYVEPNIPFFDRIIALSEMTMEGLSNRGLLTNEFLGRNEDFIDSLEFFRSIAVKQLEDEIIPDEEFERLRIIGGKLKFVIMNLPDEEPRERDARSALIADVYTNTLDEKILYEANGIPDFIYVAVKDNNGTRLTKGLVFSYYEFEEDMGERLTDEKWQEINYRKNKATLPTRPEWIQSLIK